VSISYNKLWKLLIDNHMKKKDLKEVANISAGTMAKIGKNETVSLDVLIKICKVLQCDIGDIMEVTEDINE
jgi:putative transcriptional regulator